MKAEHFFRALIANGDLKTPPEWMIAVQQRHRTMLWLAVL
jgi:hypothetical protein